MKPKISFGLLICQGIILILMNGVNSEPVVYLDKTQILGTEMVVENKKVNQYLGIPYAEAPLGDLRFKKTVPLNNYPDEIDASCPPPACLQYSDTPFPWYFNDTERSEDCLYMNIWTPADANPQNQKAVLVWIHSGNNKFGSNSLDYYSGDILAARGDIIVVTFNYRLGVFGFLSTDSHDAPGNAGLWDMKEAMMWINKNIESFGGDPSQITMAGHSSSATAIGYFTLKDENQKLFDQLILQSGSPVTFQTSYKKRNDGLGLKLAKMVGCAKDDETALDSLAVQCLKDVPADDLVQAENNLTPHSTASFHPITGDEFLPENPRKDILNGKFGCKSLLIGNNRDEGSIILPLIDSKSFGLYGEKPFQVTGNVVTKNLNRILKTFPDLAVLPAIPDIPDLLSPVSPAVNPLLNNLPGPTSAVPAAISIDKLPNGIPHFGSQLVNSILGGASSNSNCMRRQLHSSIGDMVLLCPCVYFAEKCAEQGNDVYFYYFVHQSSDSPFASWMGTTHFSEVPFVFGRPLREPNSYTKDEKKLSRQMIGFWTNFVKTGEPDPSWPKYSKEDPIYKVIGAKNGTRLYGNGPHKTNCDMMRLPFQVI